MSDSSQEDQKKLPDVEKDDFVETDDISSVLVIILQCETKNCDKNISNLKLIFSDPYFTVHVCSIDTPEVIPQIKTLSKDEYLENFYMKKALAYAAEGPYLMSKSDNGESKILPQFWWSKLPCIIIKDSSISNISPYDPSGSKNSSAIIGMKHKIKIALDRAKDAGLYFLCKWNDACDKYKDVDEEGPDDNGSKLKWSTQPTSTQAIMYKSFSRDYVRQILETTEFPLSTILNTNIAQGKLSATVFVPNIIDYDIDLATSSSDFAKLSECSSPVKVNASQSNSTASFVWMIIIIIAVTLAAFFIIGISNKPKSVF